MCGLSAPTQWQGQKSAAMRLDSPLPLRSPLWIVALYYFLKMSKKHHSFYLLQNI
jgi:hypothetical protein